MRNVPPAAKPGPIDLLTEPVKATLASIHPDPFTQGAVWRLYMEAPICLAPAVYQAVHAAVTTSEVQAVNWA